jgi:hypothetical protein
VGQGSTFRLSIPASSDGPMTRTTKHAEPSDVTHVAVDSHA